MTHIYHDSCDCEYDAWKDQRLTDGWFSEWGDHEYGLYGEIIY